LLASAVLDAHTPSQLCNTAVQPPGQIQLVAYAGCELRDGAGHPLGNLASSGVPNTAVTFFSGRAALNVNAVTTITGPGDAIGLWCFVNGSDAGSLTNAQILGLQVGNIF
jgi:hypothetical protein